MKLSSLLASSSLLALAACAGNSADGRWSGADREQIFRAFEAASGSDYNAAMLEALVDGAPQSPTACPKVVHSGSTTTVTGGCSNDNTESFSGSFTAENLPGLASYDASKPTTVHFDQFTTKLFVPATYDGDISYSGGSITTDLDESLEGIDVHSQMALTYSRDDQRFTAQPGSSIDVDGFGEADVTGTWSFPADLNGAGTGSITLTAAETLVIDMTAPLGSNCWAATIDGKAGSDACLK